METDRDVTLVDGVDESCDILPVVVKADVVAKIERKIGSDLMV